AQTTRGGDPGSRSSRLAGGAGPPNAAAALGTPGRLARLGATPDFHHGLLRVTSMTLLSHLWVKSIRFAPPIATDWRRHPRRQNLRRILHNRPDTVLRGSAPGLLQTRAPIHGRRRAAPPCRSCLRDIAARNKSDCLRPSASSARA